jgi:hypothetical protein
LAAAVVAALAVAGPAGAGPRTKGLTYGTSCIDGNNNGTCGDAADTPLAAALQDGYYNDSQHGAHSGLVIQGGVSFPAFGMIIVTNDIVISGAVKSSGDNTGMTLQSFKGNVTVKPGTAFTVSNDLFIRAYGAKAKIDIGAGGTAKVSGEWTSLDFATVGTVHVGTNQKWNTGNGYSGVNLRGQAGVTVDPVQSWSGGNHGEVVIGSGGDVTLSKVNFKMGYLLVNAYGSDANPGGRTVTIIDSTMTQSYRNGAFRISADTDRGNGALGKINIVNTTIKAKTSDVVNPMANCSNTTAPMWVCAS